MKIISSGKLRVMTLKVDIDLSSFSSQALNIEIHHFTASHDKSSLGAAFSNGESRRKKPYDDRRTARRRLASKARKNCGEIEKKLQTKFKRFFSRSSLFQTG